MNYIKKNTEIKMQLKKNSKRCLDKINFYIILTKVIRSWSANKILYEINITPSEC